MKIFMIEAIDDVPYEPSYILSEVYRNKRKAKKECKKLDLKDDGFRYIIIKGKLI